MFYVSYDGIGEPLGRSQVLAYLNRLAPRYEITLFSFEKERAKRAALAREFCAMGMAWRPLAYHKRPPVISTLLDVIAGVWALARAARTVGRPSIVHVRSYVPALIALLARRFTGGKLLFDIRGFWVDERVEGGIWPRDGVLYRIGKRCERWFFSEASAVVTLTYASLPQIRRWSAGRALPVEVIPTCTDVSRFAATTRRPDGPHTVWCGSVGTWYRFDLAVPLARALGIDLDVITRQVREAKAVLAGAPASVQAVSPEQVPDTLHAGDVGLVLCVSAFSKIASAPTRLAEHLAAGMPVIVNGGVGDAVEIVERDHVGVVLAGDDAAAITAAATSMKELLADPELAGRCRAVAARRFDVAAGTRRYAELYEQLLADARPAYSDLTGAAS